jgi:lysophospholipase L1-like esterase
MPDRRTFISSSIAAAAGGAAISGQAAEKRGAGTVPGYAYRLPAFKAGSRLVFQGDSITDMKWGRNEKDRNHYLGHSYVYLIAARLGVDIPEAKLDVYNRGMSGHKVSDLRKRWQKDAVDMKPDLLSILVGVNDAGRNVPVDAYESDYRFILDASRKANPELRLVLLDPFVVRSGRLTNDQAWQARNGPVTQYRAVVAKLVKDYDAVHIKTQEVFDAAVDAVSAEQWIWDGVHPLPQGHELIARNWLQQVSARWPKA